MKNLMITIKNNSYCYDDFNVYLQDVLRGYINYIDTEQFTIKVLD